ncbi:putative protein [Arabidopsis thaliana]|jgi:hypothetical protein|uniref:At4g28230 n=2 Tax=Arabidopsis thaliana TaxID=3702 RepID=Q9M0I4_ARATH|nr:uncharacterized protein AT4G28230 [Arabidopsis thaliana]AAP21274.1 At4g28230 [Arabidopsis thaliana]AEE85456.1 hypothetical protein AT4G28230 [Arabidopsis thaliana]CAB79625.1 putative protein [Arabidopsis thaliana]CAD5329328.1 unnamed protein product [Arabidopsis thaliana]BAF00188.1 hypothetical protein [Arabidopsis thaliana]|eukprot:NP_194552.1 hypothetical protein AT4G28230 [Arabidopsis thaliana]
MTSIEATETLNAPPKLQIWNNAAFDDGDSQITSAIEASSWSHLNESFDSDCSKENQFPISVSSSLQSSVSITEAPSAKSKTVKTKSAADRSKKRDIDAEIEEVEKEIGRLSTKLESLRLEKAEQTARSIAIRGRIVPAKFMESSQKQVKFDDSCFTGSKSRATRRGVSLGPAEIFNSAKKSETVTPLQSAQNRRKSCFFKLPGIEEGQVTTRGKGRTSLSLSPRSRKAKMTAAQKQAATTVGSKRAVKKEEGVLLTIQPKRLFKEDEKNVSLRKPLKPGRVVASRYSQMGKTQTGEKDVRKRSLPEDEEKENHKRSEKRRASDESNKSEGRVKKRWEIPSEVDLYSSGENGDESPIVKELPKIRTLRRVGGSPRDSGAAKRVAELQAKDRNFTFCQLLKFEE